MARFRQRFVLVGAAGALLLTLALAGCGGGGEKSTPSTQETHTPAACGVPIFHPYLWSSHREPPLYAMNSTDYRSPSSGL